MKSKKPTIRRLNSTEIFAIFEQICLDRFKFLVSRFHFEIAKIERETYGVFITYQSDKTAVRISLEPREGGTFVLLTRLRDGKVPPRPKRIGRDTVLDSLELDDLVLFRTGKPLGVSSDSFPTVSGMQESLEKAADALQKFGRDVLVGDFGVFSSLELIVKRRAAD